ncbi:hypothetical protein OBBRIDRAFT_808339, partial [Obba rivulosa]
VCTKVASFLEQGQRLENLSWRLWHLQNLMVDTDNTKSKRDFKKLSKCMSDKLDKEKGRTIDEDQQNIIWDSQMREYTDTRSERWCWNDGTYILLGFVNNQANTDLRIATLRAIESICRSIIVETRDSGISVGAFECLVRIMTLYHEKMGQNEALEGVNSAPGDHPLVPVTAPTISVQGKHDVINVLQIVSRQSSAKYQI